MEKQYFQAIENPRLRREFLESVQSKFNLECIKCVKYRGHKHFNRVMETYIPLRTNLFGTRGIKSVVSVFPPAFDPLFHPTLEDFLSTLIYHEGNHAKENFEAERIPPSPMNIGAYEAFLIEGEVRARMNQVKHFNEKNSKHFIKRVHQKIISGMKNLINLNYPSFAKEY